MKKQLLTLFTLFILINTSYTQVVTDGGSQVQSTTVKPSGLAGSSFNGDVNLFTGTYSGSYTLGSVATPGGLKFDVNMVYSSSLSGGDNVPAATGIPYGAGWSVVVPSISVSIADYKSYSDELLQKAISDHTPGSSISSLANTVDDTKLFAGDGHLYWFSPEVNIPGVASGRAIFKEVNPIGGGAIFVLESFEQQYIELSYFAGEWEVYLPDGTTYYFGSGTVSYRKGYNKRTEKYDELFNDGVFDSGSSEQIEVRRKIRAKAEVMSWHCSAIRNRNMPQQSIVFLYEGGSIFNSFKEFSSEDQLRVNNAMRPPPPPGNFSTANGVPNLQTVSTTDVYLKKVTSWYKSAIDIVELEYGNANYYGSDMLNPNNTSGGVKVENNMYNSKVVYSSNNTSFNGWNRYFHAKHDLLNNITGSWNIQPSATNPFTAIIAGGTFGQNESRVLLRQATGGSTLLPFDHCFLESPRLKEGSAINEIPIVPGDIYEIKTRVSSSGSDVFRRYGNVDINIVTGKPASGGDGIHSYSYFSGLKALNASKRDHNYTHEPIFSTFGNAVKWNPEHTDNGAVNTSNFFTMPNIPEEYEGITIQIGPGNSDNYFNMTPRDVAGLTKLPIGPSPDSNRDLSQNAHRTYWAENYSPGFFGGWTTDPSRRPLKQPYEAVPHNFGVGLPWMMMKPMAHRIIGNLNPNESSDLFNFWWYDEDNFGPFPPSAGNNNRPTLLGGGTRLSNVELIRYSRNAYMLKAVKTYKINGKTTDSSHPNPGKILVNQFDMDYDHENSYIVDNNKYESGDVLSFTNRQTTTYLLKSIKNVPVNGSQDLSNTLPVNINKVPTTHFAYNEFAPGIPLSPDPSKINLRTNASLFILNKITTHLGKETNINYYEFSSSAGLDYVRYRFEGKPTGTTATTISSRSFAVQLNIPVQTISVIDPTSTIPKQWDYSYETPVSKGGFSLSSNGIQADALRTSGVGIGGRGGFKITTVIEPEVGLLRPYSKYHHYGHENLNQTVETIEEKLLIGKIEKVENFDGTGLKLSQKEIFYKVNLAFENGMTNPSFDRGIVPNFQNGNIINTTFDINGETVTVTTDQSISPVRYTITGPRGTFGPSPTLSPIHLYGTYDYEAYDQVQNINLKYIKETPSSIGMGGVGLIADGSTMLEVRFPEYARDSYFIKKVKEIDTEYETTVCNVPGAVTVDPTPIPVDLATVPGAIPPRVPIVDTLTSDNDGVLMELIGRNRFGRNIVTDLIAASPLSGGVLNTLLSKRPFYRPKTYTAILAVQPILSDATFAKILTLPKVSRDKVIRKALLSQQYQISADVIRALIAAQPQIKPSVVKNVLMQYNALPEDILLAIINKNPKYEAKFITSVLLNQVQLSATVHDLLLSKKYLPNNLIKKVFTNGATYPIENTLITMINRSPKIEQKTIKKVLLASPYQHTEPTMNALTSRFGDATPLMDQLGDHNNTKPRWSIYCVNPSNNVPLSIQNITEFEYWDANEKGETTSEGFRQLLDVSAPVIRLMYEPSWQLYKTKSYSPQLPGAFTEKEFFYYYDLKNKYQRREEYIPADPNNLYDVIDIASAAALGARPFDISYITPDIAVRNQYAPYTMRHFQPIGLRFAQEFNLLNIAYQERTTSKNVSEPHPIVRSTFFHYDNDWNDIIDDLTPIVTEYSLGEPCITTGGGSGGTSTGDVFIDGGCQFIFKVHLLDIADVTPGSLAYLVNNGSLYICPCEFDTTGLGVTSIYYDNCTLQVGSNQRAPFGKNLSKTLLLKEVNTQIDTLINEDYFNALKNTSMPFASSMGLMEFKTDGFVFDTASNINTTEVLYLPVYPFDVLKVKKIKERNQFTQVQLEENEQGLLTRYYYTHTRETWDNNTDCSGINSFGNFSGKMSENIGVPIAITVGFGRPDSLRTDYDYFLDYSVKQITDPNGITLSYRYDEYGRLKESYRNSKLLSINKYSTWENDFSLSFKERSLQNYVETFQLKDINNPAALQSRKYIDPLGRDFHTMSREVGDVNNLLTTSTEVVHTGAIIYDNWNRATETFKPFVAGSGTIGVNFQYEPTSTNTTSYPNISSFAAYEDNQKSRVLKEAKPGETLGSNHNVKYTYSMANYVCGGCELELTQQEATLILGNNPGAVRFKVVEVEDEDGKVSKEYFNALGQKVATKQFIGTEDAITLFIYDSYGNLTKVINPEKQESTYEYNMLGWLFQKETVDGGITKYMFNESGQVVLEQDENAKATRSCEPVTIYNNDGTTTINFIDRPYYRAYSYDIFGRLTAQSKVNYDLENTPISTDITAQLPLHYTDFSKNMIAGTDPNVGFDIFHDGIYYEIGPNANPSFFGSDAIVYKFSNNSTYNWISTTHYVSINGGPAAINMLLTINNFDLANNGLHQFEKLLFYGGSIPFGSNRFHNTTNTILSAGRDNLKGNLSFAVTYSNSYCEQNSEHIKYDIYNYNSDGNLLWQMQQFNANGISPTSKGLVTRIDYPEYDLNNNLITENIDVNNDLLLDMQYHYTYDLRNRLRKVKVSLSNSRAGGELLASYAYNDATGLVTKTTYHKNCDLQKSLQIEQISYLYDVRDRLNHIESAYYDQDLYYDGNMVNTPLGSLATIENFNGNINATKSAYKLTSMGNYSTGNNFDKPTAYAYQYDGINRLVDANAYWDENGTVNSLSATAVKYGDVTYKYDKIGNLDRIKRTIDANNTVNNWKYRYQAGSNILTRVQGANANTSDRNYTYDNAGNLLTDDFRNVNQSIYGRANLPFDLDLGSNNSTRYLYDASDARVFKGVYNLTTQGQFELGSNIGVLTSAEYYLRDAAGNTVGILDLNTAKWTWYVFGRERFAKIKPDKNQQPKFFPADNQKKDGVIIGVSAEKQQFVNEINNVLLADTNIQTQLLKIECSDSTSFWICDNNLTNFTDTVADSTYTIVQEITLASQNQLVVLDNQIISVGVLTGRDTLISDSIAIDTTGRFTYSTDTVSIIDPANGLTVSKGTKGITKIKYTFFDKTLLKTISYYLHDHLGNTRVVYTPLLKECNTNSPTISYTLDYAADYYPYGKVLREFNPKAEKYLTTHHERDTETGLDYRGARYYDADVPHFLSLDPKAADFVSWSPYSYVLGNPIIYIDPDGKAPHIGGDNKEGGKLAKFDKFGGLTLAKDKNTQIAINIVQFGELKEKGNISSSNSIFSVFGSAENIDFSVGIGISKGNSSIGISSDGNISVGSQGVTISSSESSSEVAIPFLGHSKKSTSVTNIVTANVLDTKTGKTRKSTFPVTATETVESLTIGINKAEKRTRTQNGKSTIETRQGLSLGVSKGAKKTPLSIDLEVDIMQDFKEK